MTSVEPLRTTSYSPDIGWRVIWQRLGQECSYKDIAKRLQIGVGTAHRIFKRFESTGDVAPLARGRRPDKRKLDDYHELYIIGLVTENPAINLQETVQKLRRLPMSVYRGLLCVVFYTGMVLRERRSCTWQSRDQ